MFCGYLQGPFVSKTSLLQLDESLPDEVVFDDWFSRVVQDGALVMACPDAMYFTINYYCKRTHKKSVDTFGKKVGTQSYVIASGCEAFLFLSGFKML